MPSRGLVQLAVPLVLVITLLTTTMGRADIPAEKFVAGMQLHDLPCPTSESVEHVIIEHGMPVALEMSSRAAAQEGLERFFPGVPVRRLGLLEVAFEDTASVRYYLSDTALGIVLVADVERTVWNGLDGYQLTAYAACSSVRKRLLAPPGGAS